MAQGCFGSEVAPLRWTKRGVGSFYWWETACAEAPGPRAVVLWLRDLAKVTWWIADGEATLGLGYVPSLDEPDEALVEQAKRAAEQHWLELGL
jgi:hypothetical protein